MRIDCKKIREEILDEVKEKFDLFPNHLKNKWLVIISVGDDDASKVYIRNKLKTAKDLGIKAKEIHFDENVEYDELFKFIFQTRYDDTIAGVILQLPLPMKFSGNQVNNLINAIKPEKDIDGLTYTNKSKVFNDMNNAIIPATAKAVLRLLPEDLSGKNVALIGRGQLCNKPLISLLMNRNATVTVIHSKSDWFKVDFNSYDYIVTAVGKPKLLSAFEIRNMFD